MKSYNISYKAPDYLITGFLKGVTIKANSMLQAVSEFVRTKPDCEIIGILQNDI